MNIKKLIIKLKKIKKLKKLNNSMDGGNKPRMATFKGIIYV